MDFIIVGAGAVGAVVGTLLERSGHSVRYWARAGQTPSTAPFVLRRDGGDRIESRPLQWIGAQTGALPAHDWVLIFVRTEQLTAALGEVATQLGSDTPIAIGTVTLDGARQSARDAGLHGCVLAFHVSFGAGFVRDRELTWFPFTPPTTISAEGQPELKTAAHALADALARAGLPAQAVLDMGGMMQFLVLSNIALLPSWELCDWDIAKLAGDRELRSLTARAMHETAQRFAPERGPGRWLARGTPLIVYAFVLRVLPWLMGRRARSLWLIHGPKISGQTKFFLDEIVRRAAHSGAPLINTAELSARWRARTASR